MERMSADDVTKREQELLGGLERLVEMEMQLSRLETAAEKAIPDSEARSRARDLLGEVRDLLERQSAAAERSLQTFRAERGLAPDD